MTKKAVIGILAGLAGLSLACLCNPTGTIPLVLTPTTILPTPVPSPVPSPSIEPTPSVGIAPTCEKSLARVLRESETTFPSGQKLETDFTLVTYSISGDTLTDPVYVKPIPPKLEAYQQDTAGQQKLWQFVTNIIPSDQRTQITRFVIFTDGVSNSLGAVEQTDNPHNWMLEMDIEDAANFPDLSTTLIHEFGHLLSLNDSQVPTDYQVFNNPDDQKIYDQEAATCPTYFMFEGCSRSDSYINQFFQHFWPKIYPEWQTINAETDQDTLDQKLDSFYQEYADQFVSSYAVTSPEEDFAESFMYFVFTPRPYDAGIAEHKILFFYDYPEMVILRGRILAKLCTYVEKP